jgi:hypothetical protein
MTIAVGFQCVDGVVLGADSDVRVDRDSKHPGKKAWYLRFPAGSLEPSLRVAIVGAGGYGSIEKFVNLVRVDFKPTMSLDAAEEKIEQILLDLHERYIDSRPFENRDDLSFECLVGLRVGTETRLLRTDDTKALPVDSFYTIGLGESLAHFIIGTSKPEGVNVATAVLLTSKALLHAKSYVRDVGGVSNLVIIYNQKASGDVVSTHIEECEHFVRRMDDELRPILFRGMDASVNHESFQAALKVFSDNLAAVREKEIKTLALALNRAVLGDGDAWSSPVETASLVMPSPEPTDEDIWGGGEKA